MRYGRYLVVVLMVMMMMMLLMPLLLPLLLLPQCERAQVSDTSPNSEAQKGGSLGRDKLGVLDAIGRYRRGKIKDK